MSRRHSISIYTRFLGEKRTSVYTSREKGDHHYIQKRHNVFFFFLHFFFFFHYNHFLGKLKEKLARKARVNNDASISDRAHAP